MINLNTVYTEILVVVLLIYNYIEGADILLLKNTKIIQTQ